MTAYLGVAAMLARTGENPTCIDCGAESMGGGLWCLPCFKTHASPPRPRLTARPDAVGRLPRVRRAAVPPSQRLLEHS